VNIFVAKLSPYTGEDSLRDLFREYGEVSSVNIIMDKFTGHSKGFGFVEMPNDDEALAAITDLNDSEFHGLTIVVKMAVKRGDSPPTRDFGRGGNRGGGGDRGGDGGSQEQDDDNNRRHW
jgi:RNA recognition motif-containing protein